MDTGPAARDAVVRDVNLGTGDADVTAYSCSECGSVALDERSRQCCGEQMDAVRMDAVNEPELQTLFLEVFGVSRTGRDVCRRLIEEEQATTDELATALEINRSTVTRQLNQLRELGIVERYERPLDGGGEIHVYTPVPLDEIRQRHLEGLLSWMTDAITLVGELHSRRRETIGEPGASEPAPELRTER